MPIPAKSRLLALRSPRLGPAIDNQTFEILVCDLNIAEPNEGFVIVTAMRKAQPQSIIVPLTGNPGFETTVEGIRQDVDDYFVKPADYEALISILEKRFCRMGE
jgi:ActR/RegA family two-component response regulator